MNAELTWHWLWPLALILEEPIHIRVLYFHTKKNINGNYRKSLLLYVIACKTLRSIYLINLVFHNATFKWQCCSRYSLSTSLQLLLFVNICLVFITLNRGATSSSATLYSTDGASDTFVDYQILNVKRQKMVFHKFW